MVFASKRFSIVQHITTNEDVDYFDSVCLGDRFYTPKKAIDDAMMSRVFYNHQGLVLN